jgi:hypothetical protein
MAAVTSGGTRVGRVAGQPARASPAWLFLALLLGVFALAHDASRAWDRWNNYAGYGDLGETVGHCALDGFCTIAAVTPGGAMALAGVRPGDAGRFDSPMDRIRALHLDEQVGFELRRDGALSHHVAIATPLQHERLAFFRRPFAVLAIWAIMSLIGLGVALRSRGRVSTLLLGAALIALGSGGNIPGLTESKPRHLSRFRVDCGAALFRAGRALRGICARRAARGGP